VRYVSTRGEAPVLGFSDALLTGLARDGGLYIPEEWPHFSRREIRAMRGKSYQDIAELVLTPFVGGEIAGPDLRRMIDDAYATFRHPAVAPLVQSGPNSFILELFHGTTLAFKDVAMQLLARMMDHALAARDQRATIVGATSGDTGGAAIDAFGGRDRTDIFILFPHGKVSPVQQRQMTTTAHANVHAVAVKGTFDDCQNLVKDMFNDTGFRDRVQLAGVNSINWARIMAQIVYYFTSAVALGAPDRKISFTVPTGNFGDIFAGYAARRMGLPVHRLVIATNENDILARALKTGRYEMKGVHHDVAVDGYPDLVELRTAAVRGLRPRCDQGPHGHGRPQAVRRLRHRQAGARRHQAPVPRWPGHRTGGGEDHPRRALDHRIFARSAFGDRLCGRSQIREIQCSDGHAGHRAPGKISLGCRKCLRY